MSSFNVTGESAACGNSAWLMTYTYLYAEGSVVYSVAKARKGIMEAIAIKSVRIAHNRHTFFKAVPIYTDTYNSLWNENEICAEDVAQGLALAYLEDQSQRHIDNLMNCGR